MKPSSQRPGYVFLLTTLFIGVITAATVLFLLRSGLTSELNSYVVQESVQALAAANSCAELAIRDLRNDLTYIGDITEDLPEGSCTILEITGSGNTDRTICVKGEVGGIVRRLEITIDQIRPTTTIESWEETEVFSACTE